MACVALFAGPRCAFGTGSLLIEKLDVVANVDKGVCRQAGRLSHKIKRLVQISYFLMLMSDLFVPEGR
jgi:hypothetical protein